VKRSRAFFDLSGNAFAWLARADPANDKALKQAIACLRKGGSLNTAVELLVSRGYHSQAMKLLRDERQCSQALLLLETHRTELPPEQLTSQRNALLRESVSEPRPVQEKKSGLSVSAGGAGGGGGGKGKRAGAEGTWEDESDEEEGAPKCPTAQHVMLISRGTYTIFWCNRCVQRKSGMRWCCGICNEDFCFECEPGGGMSAEAVKDAWDVKESKNDNEGGEQRQQGENRDSSAGEAQHGLDLFMAVLTRMSTVKRRRRCTIPTL
jgi:hypothetical protein